MFYMYHIIIDRCCCLRRTKKRDLLIKNVKQLLFPRWWMIIMIIVIYDSPLLGVLFSYRIDPANYVFVYILSRTSPIIVFIPYSYTVKNGWWIVNVYLFSIKSSTSTHNVVSRFCSFKFLIKFWLTWLNIS